MSLRRLLWLLERLLVAVVLVMSGTYLLVYLYRWEWNRAIISGLFFVAAEVALATVLILRRLGGRAPGPTSGAVRTPTGGTLVRRRLRQANAARPNPFAWLKPRDGLGVFVPVLLGAGVLLSTLAYVVERLAEGTAGSLVDRDLTARLGRLAPAPGGLTGRGASLVATVPTPPPADAHRGAVRVLSTVVVVGVLAVLLGVAVQAIGDATQSRGDQARPAATTLDLEIEQKRGRFSTTEAAEALWVACRSVVLGRSRPDEVAITGAGEGRVRVHLEPGIGHLSERRLTGCLSDATLSLVQARVLDVERRPST